MVLVTNWPYVSELAAGLVSVGLRDDPDAGAVAFTIAHRDTRNSITRAILEAETEWSP